MQSEQYQSEKARFAQHAKEHLQVLKKGLLQFADVYAKDSGSLEPLAIAAGQLERDSAALSLDNLGTISGSVARALLALSQNGTPNNRDAVERRVEPLLQRCYDTLQGMVEMQEMGDAGFLAADVEREVMAGMEPVLQQLQEQTCGLMGVSELPVLDEGILASELETSLDAGDLWSDEGMLGNDLASSAPDTLDLPVGDLGLESAEVASSGAELDELGAGAPAAAGNLDELEELFKTDSSADKGVAASQQGNAKSTSELDLLSEWGPTDDPFEDTQTGRGSFEPFEPLEDLEALFAEESENGPSFGGGNEDVFSELETLTDIPAWAVTATGGEQQTWSSDLPSSAQKPEGQPIPVEYFASLDDLDGVIGAGVDTASMAEARDFAGLPFDLAELEVFLERPATDSVEIARPLVAAAPVVVPPKKSVVRSVVGPGANLRPPVARAFDQTLKVSVRQMDNLSNLIGELVVNRNSLEQDQERLRRFLDNLLDQVQNLNDLGGRMQDLYERSLLETSLLASRNTVMGTNGGGNGRGAGPGDERASGSREERDIDPLEIDRFTGFHLISQEIMEMIVRVRESSSDIEFLVDKVDNGARNLRQITTELQENVTSNRMVPFSQIADSLPRAVRDIASKMNKQAKLHVEGRDTLVDKMILEQLYDPLTHLLNNAMTHGVEAPETRVALGKDPSGRIVIRAQHQGNQTVISIADDGAGIDPERIKRKAVEKGLMTAEDVEALTELEIYDFIFHPGFSTRDKADSYAGRGVGMDVVRSTLAKLRGSINIDSKLGKGTTFTVGLPLTLSIGKALCCVHEQSRLAFPMDGVEDMFDIKPGDVYTDPTDGQSYISWQNKKTKAKMPVPYKPLAELLSHNRKRSRSSYAPIPVGTDEDDSMPVVLLRGTGTLVATQVDSVLGEQEIVIKQLTGPVVKPVGVAGATVLGDGSVMAIADVLEIIDLFQGRVRKNAVSSALLPDLEAQEIEEATEPRVLIVDDSITVRELLSMSFKKAGYRVEQARDGQEAWDKLRAGLQTDLIFCDIDMPRMDGLELLSRLSQDEELSKIPMSMLTSRGADRHRQMAAKFGAKAYFTKPYLEEVLLDAANRLREGEVLL